MPSYSPEDVGGGWILTDASNINSSSCPLAITPPPVPNNNTLVAGVGIGALLVGILIGSMLKKRGGK